MWRCAAGYCMFNRESEREGGGKRMVGDVTKWADRQNRDDAIFEL